MAKDRKIKKTPNVLKKYLRDSCIDQPKNRPCIIDFLSKNHSGECVITTKGYNCGCFIKEKNQYRKCSDSDIIRHQGFPTSFKFSSLESQKKRELGESFPPRAAKKIALELKRSI